MIISFLGHRFIYNVDGLYNQIKAAIIDGIIHSKEIVFYCGGYGDFDDLCAKVSLT